MALEGEVRDHYHIEVRGSRQLSAQLPCESSEARIFMQIL